MGDEGGGDGGREAAVYDVVVKKETALVASVDERANLLGKPDGLPQLGAAAEVAGVTFTKVAADGEADGVDKLFVTQSVSCRCAGLKVFGSDGGTIRGDALRGR